MFSRIFIHLINIVPVCIAVAIGLVAKQLIMCNKCIVYNIVILTVQRPNAYYAYLHIEYLSIILINLFISCFHFTETRLYKNSSITVCMFI